MRTKSSAALLSMLLAGGIVALPVATATAGGSYRVLHSFCKKAGCADGADSTGGVLLASDGSLFGGGDGGKNGHGVLYHLAPDAQGRDTMYARLHNFCGAGCKDGSSPDYPLIRDAAGNVYGTTHQGGARDGGTIFEASPEGKLTVLHPFCSGDCKTGFAPSSGLTYQGAVSGQPYDGVSPLYGTTSTGGSLNGGTVYAFTRQDGKSRLKTLYNFCSTLPCVDGALPIGELTVDSAGNIFGAAFLGGAHDEGAVFELSPAGAKYNYSVIYSFCSQDSCTDGTHPAAGLALDGAGNLYGVTQRFGEHDEGTVFELSPNGAGYAFQVLFQFAGLSDGGAPAAPLTVDAAGNLFGTATQGGAGGVGVVFELSPGASGWTQSVLHSFCAQSGCPDGAVPFSPLTMDASGNLFGTTSFGGPTNGGVVFELVR